MILSFVSSAVCRKEQYIPDLKVLMEEGESPALLHTCIYVLYNKHIDETLLSRVLEACLHHPGLRCRGEEQAGLKALG